MATVFGFMKMNLGRTVLKIPTEEDGRKIQDRIVATNQSAKLSVPENTVDKGPNKQSQTFGNIRTAGAFVAGAGGTVGAITSFSGTKTLDDLILNMNACDFHIQDIKKLKDELSFAEPDDSTLSEMNRVIENCKGMSSKNIAEVKSKLRAAGILSIVGAAAGITGGITSAAAVSQEKQKSQDAKKLNMAANISSGVATAGNLGGAILSGATLSGLNKNSAVAKACAGAF